MAINLSVVEVQVREERLGSSSLYHGCAADIGSETGGCGQGQGRRCFSQNSGCMNGCAQGYLSQIDDAVIVTHAPIGCSADNVGSYHARRWGNFMQGRPQSDTMALSTDMNESDTIFGGLDKLRDTVCYAVGKYNPKAVFITSSCVSAIIGEDIVSLAAELSQELGIAVVPVSCEGFKTKIWASGFDAAFHAILTGIVKPPKRKTNIVNVIQFFGSSLPYVSEALAVFGMKPRLVAGFNSIAELERLSEAAATVSICGTLGSYLGNGLEQSYGVPFVKALQPLGMVGFEDWLRSLARILGQEVAAEHYLCEQREKYLPRIEALREHLRGRRAVVGMGPSYAFNFTRVLGELGVEVDRTFAWHLDPLYDHGQKPESIAWLAKHRPHQEVRVSDLQYHELVHELRRVRPDIYFFRHPTNAGIIQKLGIPAFSVISEGCAFGYRGLWEFGQAISDTLANRNFERRLAAKTRLPFTSAWLEGPQAVVLDEDPFLKPELLEAV